MKKQSWIITKEGQKIEEQRKKDYEKSKKLAHNYIFPKKG